VRNSRVSGKYYVREHIFSEKGEIAEGRSNPKLFSGTMQKMQRTVTLCGALSANKELFMPWIRACPWLFIFREAETTWSKKRERKKE